MLESILKHKTPAMLLTSRGVTEEWSFDMESIRVCSRCNEPKPESEYNFRNRAKGYLNSCCRKCDNKISASYLEKNREAEKARKRAYYQANKARLLEHKKGYYEKNKVVILYKAKSYRDENQERIKTVSREYFANNRELQRHHARLRKIRKKTNGLFLVSLKDEKRIKNQPCFYCGSTQSIQIDHVVPLVRGGTHSIGNLVAACASCNNQKNKWFITEWKKMKREWAKNAR